MSEADRGAALIWCPFDTREHAVGVVRRLVSEELVACGNIVGEMTSVFRYEGRIDEASECGVLLKTTGDLLEAACARLAELHPYETPAIAGWHADHAPSGTLGWLAESLPQLPPE